MCLVGDGGRAGTAFVTGSPFGIRPELAILVGSCIVEFSNETEMGKELKRERWREKI